MFRLQALSSLWRAAIICIAGVVLQASTAWANPDYSLLCAPCHGEAGQGDGPAADLMWPRPANLTQALKLGPVEASIRRGVPGTMMPAFGDLPPVRRDALVAFVRALGAKDRATQIVMSVPPRPVPLPDPSVGAGLWIRHGCAGCHDGDAPGLTEQSDLFDVFSRPLKGGGGLEALFTTITRGRSGTPMPARPDLSVAARWALAVYVQSRRQTVNAILRLPPKNVPSAAREALWQEIPTPPLKSPLPILQSRRAAQCGRCHPKTHAEWTASRHAQATGPGLVGQYFGRPAAYARGCDRCHAPQAQSPTDLAHADGVSCVGCHIRGHGKLASQMEGPIGMPLRVEPRLARSDFCMPCHNLPMSAAIDGRPLLDTWREWAQSPYLPAGVQCQTCHMGQGDHRMAGAHDPESVRRAVHLQIGPPRLDGRFVVVKVAVRNIGAGHHFPTTATPRAVLRIRQLKGTQRIEATGRLWAIGRTVEHDARGWREIADTRIPAGETLERTYRVALADGADAVDVDLHFFPDWFYTRMFRGQLGRGDLPAEARAAYAEALDAGQDSVIRVDWQVRPLPR